MGPGLPVAPVHRIFGEQGQTGRREITGWTARIENNVVFDRMRCEFK
jgi:hypothetical protein